MFVFVFKKLSVPPFIGWLAMHLRTVMVTSSLAGQASLCREFHRASFRFGFIKLFSPTLLPLSWGICHSFISQLDCCAWHEFFWFCKFFVCSGATAERINLPAFFIYAFLLTGFFYPVASRWVWHPSGWLKIRGFIDFGGSGCVHMLGGVCALVNRFYK